MRSHYLLMGLLEDLVESLQGSLLVIGQGRIVMRSHDRKGTSIAKQFQTSKKKNELLIILAQNYLLEGRATTIGLKISNAYNERYQEDIHRATCKEGHMDTRARTCGHQAHSNFKPKRRRNIRQMESCHGHSWYKTRRTIFDRRPSQVLTSQCGKTSEKIL